MTVNERETTEISRSLLATSSVLTETRLLNPHLLIFSRSDERRASRAFFYSLLPFFCKDRPLQIQNQGARGIEKEKLSRSRGPGFCSPSQAFLPSFRSLSRPRLQLPPRGPIFFFSLSDPWYVCSSTPISPLFVSLVCKERRASKQAFGGRSRRCLERDLPPSPLLFSQPTSRPRGTKRNRMPPQQLLFLVRSFLE